MATSATARSRSPGAAPSAARSRPSRAADPRPMRSCPAPAWFRPPSARAQPKADDHGMRRQADRLIAPAILIVVGLGLAACAPASLQASPSAASASIPSPSTPSASATAEAAGAPAAPTGDLLGLDEAALKRWFGAP